MWRVLLCMLHNVGSKLKSKWFLIICFRHGLWHVWKPQKTLTLIISPGIHFQNAHKKRKSYIPRTHSHMTTVQLILNTLSPLIFNQVNRRLIGSNLRMKKARVLRRRQHRQEGGLLFPALCEVKESRI